MHTSHAARALLALVLSAGPLTPAAHAQHDPVDVIRALYQAHQPWAGKELEFGNRVLLSKYFAAELADLLLQNAQIAKACPEGDQCGIGFDPIIAAQDFDQDLRFALRIEQQSPPQAQSYAAHFKLFNEDPAETVVLFKLVQSDDGWRIADVLYPDLDDASLKAQLVAAQ